MTARDAARAVLAADPAVLTAADRLETRGLSWQYDPEVPGVVGLADNAGRAAAVVYLADHDFELSADVEATLAAGSP